MSVSRQVSNQVPPPSLHLQRLHATWLIGVSGCLCLAACVGGNAPSDPFDNGNKGGAGAAGKAGGAGEASGAGSGGAGSGGAGGSEAGSGAESGAGASGESGAGGSGGESGTAGSDAIEPGGKNSHHPIVIGSSWTYHHTNPTKQPWDEVATVEADTYMGMPVAAMTDEEDAQGEKTRSYLLVQGSGVYRVYKEVAVGGQVAVKVAYDPPFLRYDEAWTEGQMVMLDDNWTQTCVFTSSAAKCAPGAVKPGVTTHTWKVLDLNAEVTVPAGTFKTVQIERFNVQDNETKQFWFAAGVGKVRELDITSGATEELTEYHIP